MIIGSKGMLGSDLVEMAREDHEVIAWDIEDVDITEEGDMEKVAAACPEILINCAAFTDVDQCEYEPEKAYLVNGIGTRNITMACEEIKCPVIYISSDYVFDGMKDTPYNEWDDANPINKYGLSKLMGEEFVTKLTNRFYIVRTSWLSVFSIKP